MWETDKQLGESPDVRKHNVAVVCLCIRLADLVNDIGATERFNLIV